MIAESSLSPRSATMWPLWSLLLRLPTHFRTTCGTFWHTIDTTYAFWLLPENVSSVNDCPRRIHFPAKGSLPGVLVFYTFLKKNYVFVLEIHWVGWGLKFGMEKFLGQGFHTPCSKFHFCLGGGHSSASYSAIPFMGRPLNGGKLKKRSATLC